MYKYLKLNQSTVTKYEELTYPVFRPHLRKITSDTSKIAIGVELESEPIGLIFAQYDTVKTTPPKTYGEILSFFVVPECRNQGIGTTLLDKMETELKSRGCEEISLKYLDNPHQTFLEKILKQHNWLAPEANAFICYGTTTKIKEARIIKHVDRLSAKLPEDYTIFPWHTLTEAEIKSIKNQLETDEYAKKLTPFTEEKRIENLNSLGLRYKDKVVGWMINHRTAPDTIRYTQMYVNPDSQPLSRSILFLAKAIDIQCKTTPEVPNATFRVETHNTPMVNFVNRRLAPHLEDIRYAWEVSKTIT
ncbi:MAG: GNAT family N-acetyltransferase [Cyanobacteria bacterium J06621_15]